MRAPLCLIGAGVIARHHATANRGLADGPRPLHVTDPVPASLAAFASDFPEATAHVSVEAMLARPATPGEIAVIATPPATHHALAMAALASGRNVLVEKPIAVTAAQAAELVAEARRRGLLLHECSTRYLGYRTTVAAAGLVQGGAIGRPYRVRWIQVNNRGRPGIEYQPRSRWFLDKSVSGGGVALDWTVYDLATICAVLAPRALTVVSAWTRTPATGVELPPGTVFDVEHHIGAEISAELADGTPVSIAYERASCCHGAERAESEVAGEQGSVSWQWLPWPGDRMWLEHRYDVRGALVTERQEFATPAEVESHHRPLIALDAVLAGRPAEPMTGERAASILAVVQAIYATAADRQARTVAIAANAAPLRRAAGAG